MKKNNAPIIDKLLQFARSNIKKEFKKRGFSKKQLL